MSKSKNVVKKLTTILFTLVSVFAIGLTNVNAETTTVDVEDSSALVNAMNDKTTDIVRLKKDIILRDDLDTIFYIRKSKTLDLNGLTITVPKGKEIKFWYYEDADIKLIDSANSNTAKIIGNHTGATTYYLLHGEIQKDGLKVNFEIDGVDFEVNGSDFVTLVNGKHEGRNYENLIIKNSNVIGNQYLFWMNTAKKVYLESIKLENPTASGAKRMYLSNDSNLTINDVIDANAVVEYYSGRGVKATADSTATLDSINTYYGPITVKKKEVQTIMANNEATLRDAVNQINNSKDTVIKLSDDIKLTNFLEFYVLGNVTLDLAGNTLDVTKGSLIFYYGYKDENNYNFRSNLTIKDSGNGNNGKIIGKGFDGRVRISTIDMAEELKNLPKAYGFTIDGGTYAVTGTDSWDEYIFDVFSDSEPNKQNITLNVNVKKGIFEVGKVDGGIFHFPDTNMTANFNFETLMVKGQGVILGFNILGKKRINEVIPTDTKVYYTYGNQVIELEDKATLVMHVKTGTSASQPQYIKLAKETGLSVDNVTLPNVIFGYTDGPEAIINIANIGAAELKITNVTVSDTDKFEIIGTTQPTIGIGATNTDFKIKAKSGLSAGTYTPTIIVTDENGKTYTATVTFIVEKADITPTVSVSDVEYGTSVNPTINGNTGSGTVEYHYIDSEENDTTTKPTNAGSYKVYAIIGETTNYKGATTSQEDFTINPKSITIAVDTIADQTYTGLEITPTVVVKDGSTILTEGTDYEVVYSDNINAGTAKATISKVTNGNYTFSDKEVNFTIKKVQLEKVTLRTNEIVYNGSGSFPAMDNYNSSLQELSGTLGATNVGDYTTTVALKDKNNYEWTDGNTGNLTLNWKIIQATITDASVTLPQATYRVTGSEITPEPTVVVNGRTLTKDTDYTVSYTDNTNIGTATVTVTGKNNYKGTGIATFEIANKEVLTISGLNNNEEFTYDGTSKTPTGTLTVTDDKVTVSELKVLYEGTDNSYNSTTAPVNAGSYKVTYKIADSNPDYSGSVSYNFTIKKVQLEKVTLVTDTIVYNGSGSFPAMDNYNDSLQELSGTLGATNVGDYTTTVALKDKNNYEWAGGTTGNLTLNWKIIQATPTYELPTNLTGVKGDTLADVTLSGRFTWNDRTVVLTAGTHTYKATYTPEDTTNYKTITDIDIEVNVKDKFDVKTSVDGGNGTITESKTDVVEGTKVEITFTPNAGYMIDKVLVNTVETTVTGNKIELTVNEEKEVKVSYKKIPFTVTVKDVAGATITPNGAVAVSYGETQEFTITANSGYKLVKVLVDGTDKTADMVGDTLKLTNITSDINLEVVVEKIVYEVTEGANQKYTITKNNEAKFKINADFRLFDGGKVYVDNELVDPKNYTAESGSTIITLKKEFVDTLSVGEHTLKVLFNDGGEAITTFNVAKVTVPTDNPQTGDNIGFYIISGILSIVGLAGAGIFYRRKQTN